MTPQAQVNTIAAEKGKAKATSIELLEEDFQLFSATIMKEPNRDKYMNVQFDMYDGSTNRDQHFPLFKTKMSVHGANKFLSENSFEGLCQSHL